MQHSLQQVSISEMIFITLFSRELSETREMIHLPFNRLYWLLKTRIEEGLPIDEWCPCGSLDEVWTDMAWVPTCLHNVLSSMLPEPKSRSVCIQPNESWLCLNTFSALKLFLNCFIRSILYIYHIIVALKKHHIRHNKSMRFEDNQTLIRETPVNHPDFGIFILSSYNIDMIRNDKKKKRLRWK